MADQTVPSVRPFRPSIIVNVTELSLAHATATRDPETGVTTVAIGSVNHRVVLSDHPGVLLALLTDATAQIQAIEANEH